MLRIAVVTRYFPSSAEPWQGRSAYQTLRMMARHAEVKVFYPNAAYPQFLKPRSGGRFKPDAPRPTLDVNADYFDFLALPLVSRPFNGWMAARAVLPHVRTFAPDIVFSFYIYPDGYAAMKVAQALGVPVAAMSIGSDINRIEDRVTAHHTLTVLRDADLLLTVSEDLRRKALTMGADPARTRSVINGCDLSVFHVRDRAQARQKVGIDPETEAVVYLGRMDWRKGLRELVTAAASVHQRRSSMHVYLVGEGPDVPAIQSAIDANNAPGYIHLRPGCGFDDVALWMTAADVVTLPSYMEGCPNAVLEALACGRPVVATNVGGIPEIMSDTCGRLVPPRDADALAAALESVLDTQWDAAVISATRGRSWESVADEILEMFATIVPASRAAKGAR
jgi:teichuronic acid biosynthesis glycosyltransferase TuaC